MNKIIFDSKIADLYAEDYEYLQDEITGEVAKVFRQFITNINVPAIIKGFNIRIYPSDQTKIEVYHTTSTSTGTFTTSSGLILESSVGNVLVEMSSYTTGTINYIYARHYVVYGSYDRTNEVIIEGEKLAVDFSDYALNYDRVVNKYDIVALTEAEYLGLTSTGGYVLLGSVEADGVGNPLINLDISGRVYTRTFIGDGSISVSQLAPGFMLPQTMVDNTDPIDINDGYYGTPANIEDDLNKVRTQLRNIKQTINWDDTIFGIETASPSMDRLHKMGVAPDYQDAFDYEITSSGVAILVKPGRFLYKNKLTSVTDSVVLPFSALSIYQVGNITYNTGYELSPSLGPAPDSFTLQHHPMRNLRLTENDASPVEYTEGDDFTYVGTTGVVRSTSTGDIQNEEVRCYYQYGTCRCDAIVVFASTGVMQIIEGVETSTGYYNPPIIPDNYFPLYFVYRPIFSTAVIKDYIVSTIIDLDLTDQTREIDTSTIDNYIMYGTSSGIFYDDRSWSVHKLSITSSGVAIDTNPYVWTVTSTGLNIYDTDLTIQTIINTKEDDELYLYLTPTITSGGTVILEYESVSGSDVFDESVTVDIPSCTSITNTHYLLFLTKGFSEGYHKIKIKIDGVNDIYISKIIIDKLNYYYEKDNLYIKDSIVINVASISTLITNTLTATNAIINTIVSPLYVSDTTDSISKDTGSIITDGGVGVEKSVVVGGIINVVNTTNSISKDTGSIITDGGVGVEKSVVVGGIINVVNTTNSISKDTGSIITEGGVGIEKSVFVGGIINVVNTTDSTTINTGSIITDGGIGVEKSVVVGGIVNVVNTTDSISTGTGSIITDGGVGVEKSVVVGGIINVVNTTDSTTINTGSIVTEGGVGIEKSVFVGGIINVVNTTDSVSTSTGSIITEGGIGVEKSVVVGGNVIDTTGILSNFTLPTANDSSIDNTLVAWTKFKHLLDKSVTAGSTFSNPIASTYALVYTRTGAYCGGVLAPNGDIHFIPDYATVGQKINSSGVVSTYALLYTANIAYCGGVLAPNGDIHFIPNSATKGQKINSSGVVSTYALLYTVNSAYYGGVLAPDGDIHFAPYNATKGQRIDSAGASSTYALIITGAASYAGGVLAPNGDIHFVPFSATVGQKIDSAGVAHTYDLAYTVSQAYYGGALAPNGDIHFVPYGATVGQKIDTSTDIASTYPLVYTTTTAYRGGVLAPNGDIHFVPDYAAVGQKIDTSTDIASTYALEYTAPSAYCGGVLAPNGDIHFVPFSTTKGQKLSTLSGMSWSKGICCHPFFNKL